MNLDKECRWCEGLGYRTISVENDQGSGDIVQEDCTFCKNKRLHYDYKQDLAETIASNVIDLLDRGTDGSGFISYKAVTQVIYEGLIALERHNNEKHRTDISTT